MAFDVFPQRPNCRSFGIRARDQYDSAKSAKIQVDFIVLAYGFLPTAIVIDLGIFSGNLVGTVGFAGDRFRGFGTQKSH
jgi:hypothetical protein